METSDSSSITGLLILAVVLILLSMIFSASESAFLSINKLRLRLLRNKKDKRAIRAGKLLDKKEKLLNTILVGNNIVNIALSAIITSHQVGDTVTYTILRDGRAIEIDLVLEEKTE